MFALGLLTRKASGTGAVVGLLLGFLFNLICWVALPGLSWLWWNVFGFLVTGIGGYLVSLQAPSERDIEQLTWHFQEGLLHLYTPAAKRRYKWLAGYAVLILLMLFLLEG